MHVCIELMDVSKWIAKDVSKQMSFEEIEFK